MAAQFRIVELTAPSYWASYLINGDASGMDDEEITACDAWIKREGLGSPCGCTEAGFVKWHDARFEMPYAADCEVYTFLVDITPAP